MVIPDSIEALGCELRDLLCEENPTSAPRERQAVDIHWKMRQLLKLDLSDEDQARILIISNAMLCGIFDVSVDDFSIDEFYALYPRT